ncbi:MAG: putative C-S lyase [Gammaproteobacteria bacterium]|nr:PatB family C-S lyase [Gammaproteobacteria bacterium]NNM01108.1 putative C-S lyase [Gammaproteobacteria bacterium]
MSYDFDRVIDRRPTHSMKWAKYAGRDILPMWVADTEFAPPPAVTEALIERAAHGPLGYTLPYPALNEATIRWLAGHHDWQVDPDWLLWMPGVVPAFHVICKAFCTAGDRILAQTPNYPPILRAPALHDCEGIVIPTVAADRRWALDLEALAREAADPRARVFILTNPMNPCGSVLTRAELETIALICAEHEVILCSDEIHCDLILDPAARHIPAPSLAAAEPVAISLMAPSKTFNIAGLGTSFTVIPDARLRARVTAAAQGILASPPVLGLVAAEAAFRDGAHWHRALIDYLRDNRDFLAAAINAIDGLEMYSPAATFLAWVDCDALSVDDVQAFWEQAGIGPSPGRDFGAPRFARLNFGCPRSMLAEVLARLQRALTGSAA